MNESYNLDLKESEEYETLAGLIISATEDIPSIGDVIDLDGYEAEILKVSGHKIEEVSLRPSESAN